MQCFDDARRLTAVELLLVQTRGVGEYTLSSNHLHHTQPTMSKHTREISPSHFLFSFARPLQNFSYPLKHYPLVYSCNVSYYLIPCNSIVLYHSIYSYKFVHIFFSHNPANWTLFLPFRLHCHIYTAYRRGLLLLTCRRICVSVCPSGNGTLQKRLDRSRCRLACGVGLALVTIY